MVETGTLKIENGKLEFIKFGQGKETLIILPGLSYDGLFPRAEEIEHAYKIFADKFTVYLIDRNLKPKAGYSVDDVADDMAEAFEKLGIKRADVFGASFGGMVAQKLAIKYPRLINKLVLGSTLSHPNGTFLSVLSRWENFAINNDIDGLTKDINGTIYSPETLKKYAAVFSAIKIARTEEKTARFIVYINAAKNFDAYGLLKRINAETFVIGAKCDKITIATAARDTAKALNCKYYEYENFGHAAFDEAPDYKKRVYNFLMQN